MDIKSVIEKYGMSKAEIARKMETSPSYISQLVSGQPEPTLRKLQQLADIVGCKRWEFFLDEMPEEVRAALEPQQTIHLEKIGDMPIAPCPIPPEKPAKAELAMQQALICPHCGGAMVVNVAPVKKSDS